MSRLLSSCCQARANVNVRDGGYLCSKCGSDCTATAKKTGLATRSTLSTVHKPTGERPLFIELWAKCKGKSEVSGDQLLPPEHSQFHFQGHHLLPKGTYPDYRLDERNIVMMTIEEHDVWHSTPIGLLLASEKWGRFVARMQALKAEAQRKGKVVGEETPDAA